MIMGRTAARQGPGVGLLGQTGRNGHARARRESRERLINGIARGERFLYVMHFIYLRSGVYLLIRCADFMKCRV